MHELRLHLIQLFGVYQTLRNLLSDREGNPGGWHAQTKHFEFAVAERKGDIIAGLDQLRVFNLFGEVGHGGHLGSGHCSSD